jgi:putative transposase
MVSPALRREWVRWARDAYQLSERRASRATGVALSTIQYKSRRSPRAPLRARLRELAASRVSFGYQRLHVLLRREGWRVNHKLVLSLYREEGLMLKRQRPKRRKSATVRVERPVAASPNERWAMDFVHDTLIDGRSIRVLAVLDVFTRECVALRAKGVFRGEDVAAVLSTAGDVRQLPQLINVDNGTEFTSRSLDHWAYWNKVRLDFSRPGKPTDNAFIESFNSSLRRECLSQHYFINLDDANRALDRWRDDYNNTRPHSSLGNVPPAHFGAAEHLTPARNQLEKLQIS